MALMYVVQKDCRRDIVNQVEYYAIALGVFDMSDPDLPSEGIYEYNAKFLQGEDMTNAYVGITDYGAVFFNTENSDMGSNITIVAVDENGEELVNVTTTLQDLANKNIGDSVT